MKQRNDIWFGESGSINMGGTSGTAQVVYHKGGDVDIITYPDIDYDKEDDYE